jgi:CheY-like chemotaxis protein
LSVNAFRLVYAPQEIMEKLPPATDRSGRPFSPAQPVGGPRPETKAGRKILLVEDHDSSGDVFTAIVQHLGYQAIRASDGREAIKRSIAEQPDLIVMDIMMPSMDGIEATRQIKRTNAAHIPIVILTAALESGIHTNALSAGAAEVITKPITIAELSKTLRKYLPYKSSAPA